MPNIICSACGLHGHNKRNKTCSARTINETQSTIVRYRKPIILFDPHISQYYSVFEKAHISTEVLTILRNHNPASIRWAFYSLETNLYCISNNPSNYNPNYIVHIAFPIIRPTNAVMHIKSWNLTYSPQLVSSSECPICYETIHSYTSVHFNCNHNYCFTCIHSFISSIKDTEQPATCPMCRTVVTDVHLPDPIVYNSLAETLYQL